MEIGEFRESFINEDINAEATNTQRYPEEVFIDHCVDILKNDYSLISDMANCYFQSTNGNRAYKSMHIDAANLDLSSNTLDLLIADYNTGKITNITRKNIDDLSQQMINYFENCLKGYFVNAEMADPAVQLANDILNNFDSIYQIHLFIVSTNTISKTVKKLAIPDYKFKDRKYKVVLDVLDIEKIFKTKMVGFEKEDLIINCKDYGVEGIPCIKADLETDQYESYLAIVPGAFLSDIYKDYSSTILESNVRAFLKFNGNVNKGIRGTILNEKSRFFTYNNGISTTAESVETVMTDKGLYLTSFKNLQIINGGQTTATLAATNIKNNADLSGIFVQMKLTVIKDSDPDLIRNIANYANSQNRIKNADLNSGHPFYVRMEDFSRKSYAPLQSGELVQQLWFFERIRGQYEQPLMQMNKRQRDDYKLVRPKSKKFTLTDLTKYMNAADMLPYFVAWGGEVNARHFHNNMLKQWNKDNSVYNELFYKELVGKKIFFNTIEAIVSDQIWYQEKRAYRPQIVAYTFSKFVYEAQKEHRYINFRSFWDLQEVPEEYVNDIANISKLVFDIIYDENRSTANIETYCKKQSCWDDNVKPAPYKLSNTVLELLVTKSDKVVESTQAKKEQKFSSEINNEISIFNKGAKYWTSLIERGKNQGVLTYKDEKSLYLAVDYCNFVKTELKPYQVKEIISVLGTLKENGIE